LDQPRRCPKCGAELALDAPEGLCPSCLMKAGLGAAGTGGSRTASVPSPEPSGLPGPGRPSPEVGRSFGPYRLVRLLGKGGMGAVYEAEHLESGRRVALKVLGHSLDSPEARARFLREGRLAASINHPNNVYIYGTEEIEGTPSIAMELVAGGTLEDRVRQKGPLPAAEAVDVILQIIEGLEAAQAVGVLHRDVKPSNCFLETGGAVKVGDFGLSISTKVRGEMNLTTTGAFMGTPAFASPEQMRGDELDVRSDIYSVGGTLYYLLTGRTPFRADNLVRFIATVLERPAESPAKIRHEIPAGLCRAVLRCLEKQPAGRFRNYGDLRQALAPFASTAPTPGTLGLRFLAAAVDMTAWSVAWMPVSFTFMVAPKSGRNPFAGPAFLALTAAGVTLWILYYALAEGLWGASLGKAVCRLRVIGPGRSAPGLPRALLRAAIYVLVPIFPMWIYCGFDPERLVSAGTGAFSLHVMGLSVYVLYALLFVTARRRNGFAGVHDLASGTRVIRKAAYQARPVLQSESRPLPVGEVAPAIGPYHVLETLGATETGELLLGYDARLLRKVWIRRPPEGAPPAAAGVRGMGRATRLRWLGGKRSAGDNWDAYEAPPGAPLLALLDRRRPWGSVRYWLLDLAEELRAGLKDESAPPLLGLDRIWITADGRAKLLDFAAPGTGGMISAVRPPAFAAADFGAGRLFLTQVALAALEGRVIDADAACGRAAAVPLPLHARTFLEGLPALQDFGTLIGCLKPLLEKAPSVTRWRRLGLTAVSGFLPILAAVGTLLMLVVVRNFARGEPDIEPLRNCLMRIAMMGDPPRSERDRQQRQALESYIAGRFRGTISDPASWSGLYAKSFIPEPWRETAERIIATRPAPSEKELAEATALVTPILDEMKPFGFPFTPMMSPFVALSWAWIVAFLSLACTLLFRGGLAIHLLGVTVVNRDGSPASRLGVFRRGLAAWLPVLALPIPLGSILSVAAPSFRDVSLLGLTASLVWALYVPLVIGSALLPERGLHDRLARTWLVPR
jgi:uncharacterized RDD family membrane protein YckC